VATKYPEGIDVTATATKSLRKALKQEKKKLSKKATIGTKQRAEDARMHSTAEVQRCRLQLHRDVIALSAPLMIGAPLASK